ncbi:MAG TPA: hypothetical protein VL049_04260 [Candidatus Dormibacteraeota bacterium]|nr:hypothetical protein [Candidatus Dormibacteraeota bacterium]
MKSTKAAEASIHAVSPVSRVEAAPSWATACAADRQSVATHPYHANLFIIVWNPHRTARIIAGDDPNVLLCRTE